MFKFKVSLTGGISVEAHSWDLQRI